MLMQVPGLPNCILLPYRYRGKTNLSQWPNTVYACLTTTKPGYTIMQRFGENTLVMVWISTYPPLFLHPIWYPMATITWN